MATQINPLYLWRNWIVPRSPDRDIAFRERTIRGTAGIMLLLTAISLPFSLFMFAGAPNAALYNAMTIADIVIFGLSVWAVAEGHVTFAGQMLVLGLVVTASVVTYTDGFWQSFGTAMFMLVVLISALVLPRNAIFWVAVLSVILFSAASYIQKSISEDIPVINGQEPEPSVIISNLIFLLIFEVLFLRQLRLEFDNRLRSVTDSLQQAEVARQEADRANKAKSQFLASMSHEFRTPLNAIIGYADIMLAGMAGTFTEKQNQLHGHIRSNAKRLLGLINDTLDMARIEAGKIDIKVTPLAPRQLATELIGGMESLAQNKQIYLKTEIQPNTPETVICDVAKLQQIMTNLVGNALKFTHAGGVTLETGGNQDGKWYFKVTDTGIGMPEDAANYIFETFQQVEKHDNRRYEGTGLGLAITHRLVLAMGGTITVATQKDVGSTFTVTLPCEVKPTV